MSRLSEAIAALGLKISAFSRYSSVHFVPDVIGDLVFNGNATDVFRSSLTHGVQFNSAYRADSAHTFRFGLTALTEHTRVVNGSIVLPTDADGNPIDAPFGIVDQNAKTG